MPGEGDVLQVGDEAVDPLQNAYVGDEAPGGDMPTPDQDLVDEIGRAYGVHGSGLAARCAPRPSSWTSATAAGRSWKRRALRHGTRDEDRERNR